MGFPIRDHIVRWRSQESIISLAEERRKLGGFGDDCDLDMCSYIKGLISNGGLSRPTELEFFDACGDEDLAFVTYGSKTTINVDRELWQEATFGEPGAKYILAHEVGHADMHDERAKAYSGSEEQYVKSVGLERSAERQAHLYAHHLLVPDWLVRRFKDERLIVSECNVQREVASRRIEDFKNRYLQALQITGEYCSCGNFLFKRGERYICKTCFLSLRI